MAEHIVLSGTGVTAILELAPGEAPLWRYWGPRLPEGAAPGFSIRDGRPLPSFSLDHNQPLSVFPTFGVGWFGQSALLAHRGGKDFAQSITATAVEWIVPGRSVRLVMDDAVASICVTMTLDLDPASDVLTVSTMLANTGSAPLDVQWLAAASLPLPFAADAVRHFTGRHNNEFQLVEEKLGRGSWRRENRRGLTSHEAFPGAVVTLPGATQHGGTAYGAQLAWSGNHAQQIEWLDEGHYQWQFGEWLAPGEISLAPGETLESPELLATCSTGGLNGIAQNFHAAIRARMDWPGGAMAPRPVHLNTWEGFYFDHDLDKLKALADASAEVGIERWVLDDGWFHKRHDDRAALGDWWPDADKYPDGLKPLVDHVVGLGMEFGLWVEPEMINPDSELYRAHPDWALQIDGRPLLTARNQLVLDMTRAEVGDYLFEKIAAQLEALPIGYLKWDHNRDLTTAGSRGHAAYHAQVHAAYALFVRLRSAFPNVEIEACAGGGGRIDAGILRHTHRFWTSDCIDAVTRLPIQRGFLQFMPPEVMGSHVGTAPAHSTGRAQSMAFRASLALTGHLGVEFDLTKMDAADRATLKDWIALYKGWRDQLHAGRVWIGETGDSLFWQAHGSAQDLLLFVYRDDPTGLRHLPPLQLPMLDAAKTYRVERIDPKGPSAHAPQTAPLFEAMRAGGVEMSGAWLAQAGLPMPAMKAESCAIYKVIAR